MNLQARIAAHLLELQLFTCELGTPEFKDKINELLEPLKEIIAEGEFEGTDMCVRALRFFITNIDERESHQS